jgi:hypothetical protein
MQTSLLQGLFLDLVSFCEHLLGSAKVNIRGSEIVQGLMVALVVVIIHESSDLGFQMYGQKIILQVHDIFHRTVVAFNLALGHRVVGRRTSVVNVPAFQEGS